MKRLARRVTPRTIITVCSIGLPALVLLIGVLLAQQTMQNSATNRAVNRSMVMHTRLQSVFSLVQDAEAGQRGYLLTNQEQYLRPYNAATGQIGPQMSRLENMLRPDPEQFARVEQLKAVIAEKMAEMNRTITLNRQGNHAGAVAIVSSGGGYALMDRARKITTDMHAAQMREQAADMTRRNAGYDRTLLFVGVLLAALVLLIGFSVATALYNYRSGQKVIADIRQLSEQLKAEKERLLQTVEELNRARMSADDANRAKSEFLASMSHELRTPLNAILGFSEIIKDEIFGPVGMTQYVDYANDVHSSGQHLLDLINDVLDLSKIQAGKVELREEAVNLSALLLDSIALTRERALKNGVSLVFDKQAGGPVVFADRRLLKQILLNLLSNAVKFTPAGGSVTAKAFSSAQGAGFSIQDTGIGMSKEDIAKAMSPYGQIDSQLSRKHEGTGLGLPISQSLATLHGGTLVVESEPGRGTVITLTLPAARIVTSLPAKTG